MGTIAELERLMTTRSSLEDEFIKESLIRIDSYNSFMEKLSRCEQRPIRITLYSEDIPKHKYIANINKH